MKKLIFSLLFLNVFLTSAQGVYDKNKILDSVAVPDAKNENFALYLPDSFDPSELNSVVFIFEPLGRGKLGVQVFVEAAKAHGHMLVCSNNIKNGPYETNFAMAERLFNYIFSEFNIDENQIYLSGFSGGSRLASAIATLTNMPAGVIACGAGFTASHSPSTQKFEYVGICGNKDMNFMEMMSVRQYLQKLKFDTTLFTFDGDHRWPPQEQILRAFDWLSVRAHKNGLIKKSEQAIKNSYIKNLEFAEKAAANNNVIRAVEDYERILSTYKAIYTLDSIAAKIEFLKKSKTNKNATKSRKIAFEKENKYTEIVSSRFHEDFNNPKRTNISWWKKQLRKIDKELESADPELINMVARLRYKIYAMAYEKMIFARPKATPEQVAFSREICKLIYPDF